MELKAVGNRTVHIRADEPCFWTLLGAPFNLSCMAA
jgi:hypothetical protein